MLNTYNTAERYNLSKNYLSQAIDALPIPSQASWTEIMDLKGKVTDIYKKYFISFYERCDGEDKSHQADFRNLKTDLKDKYRTLNELQKKLPFSTQALNCLNHLFIRCHFNSSHTALKNTHLHNRKEDLMEKLLHDSYVQRHSPPQQIPLVFSPQIGYSIPPPHRSKPLPPQTSL